MKAFVHYRSIASTCPLSMKALVHLNTIIFLRILFQWRLCLLSEYIYLSTCHVSMKALVHYWGAVVFVCPGSMKALVHYMSIFVYTFPFNEGLVYYRSIFISLRVMLQWRLWFIKGVYIFKGIRYKRCRQKSLSRKIDKTWTESLQS